MNTPATPYCSGCLASFHIMLENRGLNVADIEYLLSQGVQVEKLKLEVQHCTDQDSIASRIRIMNGERLLFYLSLSPC